MLETKRVYTLWVFKSLHREFSLQENPHEIEVGESETAMCCFLFLSWLLLKSFSSDFLFCFLLSHAVKISAPNYLQCTSPGQTKHVSFHISFCLFSSFCFASDKMVFWYLSDIQYYCSAVPQLQSCLLGVLGGQFKKYAKQSWTLFHWF